MPGFLVSLRGGANFLGGQLTLIHLQPLLSSRRKTGVAVAHHRHESFQNGQSCPTYGRLSIMSTAVVTPEGTTYARSML